MPKEIIRRTESKVAALDRSDQVLETVKRPELSSAQRERLERCIGEIEAGPFGHGLARRLGEFLTEAPVIDLKRLRPLALARNWDVQAEAAVELCVAAQRPWPRARGK